MKRIELITSKEYWVETLELMQMQGHTDYDIATVIANKMEESMNYMPCCEALKCKEELALDVWLKDNNYKITDDGYTRNGITFSFGEMHKRYNEYLKLL